MLKVLRNKGFFMGFFCISYNKVFIKNFFLKKNGIIFLYYMLLLKYLKIEIFLFFVK
jgi:hypothetical protein